MFLHVMKLSQSVQLPAATTVSNAITAWQRRFMLPVSLWMAAISRLFHYKHCVILSKL